MSSTKYNTTIGHNCQCEVCGNELFPTADLKSYNDAYRLGKRDAAAEIIMLVRIKGEVAALLEVAQQLISIDPDNPNPHAKWYVAAQLPQANAAMVRPKANL